jgi:small subunit ribosomal protein S16
MAVVIRLARAGAKKQPFHHIVVADSRKPRDGRRIEAIGTYDARCEPERIIFKSERLDHFLKVGAKPSDRVRDLIKVWRKSQKPEARA